MNSNAPDIDGYLAALPEDARTTLAAMRQTIRAAAPDAVESISYGMPTFKYRGKPLVYFAAAKKHCALYGTSRGTMRFAPDQPPPEALVQSLVRERIERVESAAAGRKGASSRARQST